VEIGAALFYVDEFTRLSFRHHGESVISTYAQLHTDQQILSALTMAETICCCVCEWTDLQPTYTSVMLLVYYDF